MALTGVRVNQCNHFLLNVCIFPLPAWFPLPPPAGSGGKQKSTRKSAYVRRKTVMLVYPDPHWQSLASLIFVKDKVEFQVKFDLLVEEMHIPRSSQPLLSTCGQFHKHFTFVTYDINKVSCNFYCMHAPMQVCQNALAYIAKLYTWHNYEINSPSKCYKTFSLYHWVPGHIS